jgi:Uma2 family endonuclease
VRLELFDGRIVNTAGSPPDHSFAKTSLVCVLGNHLDNTGSGELFSGVGVELNACAVLCPDLCFCSFENANLVGDRAIEGPPDLAVEVVDPSSETIDRKDKFAQYRKAGVRFYWIVDPQTKTIEGWELKNRRYVPAGRGQGSALVRLPPFEDLEIPLGRLWRSRNRRG